MRIDVLRFRVWVFLVAGFFAVATLAVPVSFDSGEGVGTLKAAYAQQPQGGQPGHTEGQQGGGGGGQQGPKGPNGVEGESGS